MIPLRDNIPSRSTPFVNYFVIVTCTLVFLAQLGESRGQGSLIERYGMIPVRVIHPNRPVEMADYELVRTPFDIRYHEVTRQAAESAVAPWLTVLTCIFLHGGWMHFLGNMWFLYIFGDNVEDRFGHFGYLMFYLGCGIAASLTHLLTNLGGPSVSVPTIGASGAIAGVMGAYFLLYPRAKVVTIVPILFFIQIIVLPASIFLGIWFAIQIFQGTSMQSTGVAWWAHIGGFLVGMLLAWQLKQHHKLRPPVERVLPHTDHVTAYRFRRQDNPWH